MNNKMRTTILAAVLLCCLALSGGALAARLNGHDLAWRVLGSAGGGAESASYALNATLGQPATGLASSTSYQMKAGFWHGLGPPAPSLPLFLPLVLSSWSG